jgi:hypothetical protein
VFLSFNKNIYAIISPTPLKRGVRSANNKLSGIEK